MDCGGQDVKTIKIYVIYGFNNLSAAARIIYLFSTDFIMLIYGGDWSRDPRTEKLVHANKAVRFGPDRKILKDTSESDDFRCVAHPMHLRIDMPTQRLDLSDVFFRLCVGLGMRWCIGWAM